jgi:hypothetical protein
MLGYQFYWLDEKGGSFCVRKGDQDGDGA